MNKLIAQLLLVAALGALSACGKQDATPASTSPATAPETAEQAPAQAPASAPEQADATAAGEATQETTAPAESVSEVEDGTQQSDSGATVQPSLQLAQAPKGPPTSSRFREGTHYQKLVPAQPTNVPPDKVEVIEVFWYGCGHCYSLDPALEAWRAKSKPDYVEFVRLPAMWNDSTRMHARLFYTVEALGKLEQLHTAIFREIHVNGNQLNTLERMTAFVKQHGVSPEEFTKAFSSFAVESKLQRADFLNRRYRVQSVPMFVIQGKYTTGVGEAGGEVPLFDLIGELAAHEHGR
ncbi:MAG TPA: thiol:disulfide interchange protein DsbA/DsbL [Steroidobacter sp.]